jgi:hypothetical protein
MCLANCSQRGNAFTNKPSNTGGLAKSFRGLQGISSGGVATITALDTAAGSPSGDLGGQ